MNLRSTLNRLVRVVTDEAERNPAFEAALNEALGTGLKRKSDERLHASEPPDNGGLKRGKNRRPQATLDPVQVVREGEPALRSALEKLSIDQLLDIIAEYGMDPGRQVMKWKAPERVIDRIVEMSTARAHKGDAFRKPAGAQVTPADSAVGPLALPSAPPAAGDEK